MYVYINIYIFILFYFLLFFKELQLEIVILRPCLSI